ncbi:apomucin-like [Ciona intestinalis]
MSLGKTLNSHSCVTCASTPPTICPSPHQKLIANNDCCNTSDCVCQSCPELPPCPAGQTAVDTIDPVCGCKIRNCTQKYCPNGKPVGSTWTVNNCSTCQCDDVDLVTCREKICPDFDQNCPLKYIEWDSNHCCKKCNAPATSKNCTVENYTDSITVGNCKSVAPVDIANCTGLCTSTSRYVKNILHTNCQCCSPNETMLLDIQMKCTNGTTYTHKQKKIISCNCTNRNCL